MFPLDLHALICVPYPLTFSESSLSLMSTFQEIRVMLYDFVQDYSWILLNYTISITVQVSCMHIKVLLPLPLKRRVNFFEKTSQYRDN